jgi:hypothetical protein
MAGVKMGLEETGRKELIALLKKMEFKIPNINKQILSLICEDIVSISQAFYMNGPRLKGGGHIERQSGKLANSLSYKVLGYMDAEIGTDVIYAAIHEFGGTILPKNAKSLHWVNASGEDVFRKKVVIPPRSYLKPAIDKEFLGGPTCRAMRIANQEIANAYRQNGFEVKNV